MDYVKAIKPIEAAGLNNNDFEMISEFINLDDEFLQSNRSVSIIESIVSMGDR